MSRGCAGSGEMLGRRDLDRPHAFRLKRSQRSVAHAATRDLAGERTNQYFPVPRHLLESRRDNDRLSGDEELGAFAVPGHDLAGVDPDAEREPGPAVLAV